MKSVTFPDGRPATNLARWWKRNAGTPPRGLVTRDTIRARFWGGGGKGEGALILLLAPLARGVVTPLGFTVLIVIIFHCLH